MIWNFGWQLNNNCHVYPLKVLLVMVGLVVTGLCFPTTLTNHIEENPLKDILSVIKCIVSASDRFWRAIYESGIWISRPVASKLVIDGWTLTVPVFGFALLFTDSFSRMGINSQMFLS